MGLMKMAPQQRDMMNPPQLSEFPINNKLDPKYPEGINLAVCLVHNIDVIFPSLSDIFHSTYRHMKTGLLKDSFRMLFSSLSRKFNPLFNFEKVIELEHRYGATSGFYFSVLHKGEKGYNYDISDLACELKNIRENGWEVGFLGSQGLCCDAEYMLSRKQKLEDVLRDKVVGYVNPHHCFTLPETCKTLDMAGFEYIITFVDPECMDLSESMYRLFRANYFNENKDMGIMILLASIRESTMFNGFANPKNMDNDVEEVWKFTKHLIDKVSENLGVLVLSWPNTSMLGEGLDFYEKTLSYCSMKGAWLTSGKEIVEWWGQSILKK